MLKTILLKALTILLLIIHNLSCSFSPPSGRSVTLTIELPSRSNSQADFLKFNAVASSVDDFTCFVVNIMGTGIINDSVSGFPVQEEEALFRYENGEGCFYPGIVSPLLSNQSSNTVHLEVPTGPDRIIHIWGLSTQLECPTEQSLSDLLPTYEESIAQIGSIIEIGSARTDLYTDTSIEIANAYDPHNVIDLTDCLGITTAPEIHDISPALGPKSGGTEITLSGTGFDTSSIVQIGSSECTILGLSETEMTCITNSFDSVGIFDVVVTNAAESTVVENGFLVYDSIDVTSPYIAVSGGQIKTLSFDGGLPPFTYSYSGSSSFDEDLLYLTGGNTISLDTLTVTDSTGFSVEARVLTLGHTTVGQYDASTTQYVGNLSDGDSVPILYDLSGHSHDASQAVSISQPKLIQNELNGLPVIRFDGVDDSMLANLGVASQPMTYVAVLSINDSSDMSIWDGSSATRNYMEISSGNLMMSDGTDKVHTASWPSHTFITLTAIYDSATSELIINGTTVGTGDAGSDGISDFHLGTDWSTNGFFKGDIAELYIFNSHLTADEVENVECFLSNRYDISTVRNCSL